jgi:hypothetical protein
MSSFHIKLSLLTLGIVLGIFLLRIAYRYYLAAQRKNVFVPRIVLHSVENFISRGEVVFHFEVKEAQAVIFDVCNNNFEALLELENKTLEDGSYTITFDTRTVPNGEYFYRLRAPEQQVMKKFEVRN